MQYLIAIDNDGTLKHSDGTISVRTKNIVQKLILTNIIVVCTARPRYHTLIIHPI
ncbi:MAG: HAD hydrolase family protein [Bacilli bacterium]